MSAGAPAEIAVRLVDPDGRPLADQEISFSLEGDVQGATLAAPRVITGAEGLARAQLNPGMAPAYFSLRATAFNAAPLQINITVSKGGFANLDIDVIIALQTGAVGGSSGDLPGARNLQVRLYRQLGCDDLDPVSPPTPVRPPADVPDPTRQPDLSYVVALDDPPETSVYTLLATATDLFDELIGSGCVTLSAGQLTAPGQIAVVLPVRPVIYDVAGSYRLISALLAPTDDDIFTEAFAPLQRLAECPATVLLDCLVDAGTDLDASDCLLAPADASDLTVAVEHARPSPRGTLRCRDDGRTPDQGQSLDRLVTNALLAARPDLTSSLRAVYQSARGATGALEIESRIELYAPGAEGTTVFDHILDRIDVTSGGIGLAYPAAEFGLQSALAVPARYTAPLRLSLGSHVLSLAYGALAITILDDLALGTRGATSLSALFTDLIERISLDTDLPGGERSGCEALSWLVCDRVGLPATCAIDLCERVPGVIEGSVKGGLARLGQAPVPFILSGEATLTDGDGDRVTDGLSGGMWTGQLTVSSGRKLSLSGPFTGVRPQ